MAILFMESFDHYNNAADLLKKWTANNSFNPGTAAGAGRRGTQAYASQIHPMFHIYKALTPGDTKFLAAGAFKFVHLSALPNCFSAQDGGESRFETQVVTYVTLAGEIAVYHGANTMTHIATTSGAGITAGVYFHLSVEIVIHPSAGSVKLAVNGVTLIDTGPTKDTQYTANTRWTGVRVGGEAAGAGSQSGLCYCDDLVIGDGTGSTSNSLLPELRVDPHYPNADGNSSMSTPSGSPPGNRYDNVNDTIPAIAPDDYNTLVAINDKDTLAMQNLVAPGAEIKAVQLMMLAKKTDSGPATVVPVFRQGSNEHDGTVSGLSTTYNYIREVFNQNPIAGGPATPGPWTEADFNALEVGYKRIT